MEAQLQSRLARINVALRSYSQDIRDIRYIRWDKRQFPRHADLMAAKRAKWVAIGDEIALLLEELNVMSLGDDPKPTLKKIKKAWTYGIRQLAIADAEAAVVMAKKFRKEGRSAAGDVKVAWALIRGSKSYFLDDGKAAASVNGK